MHPTIRLLVRQPAFVRNNLRELEFQSRRIIRGEYLHYNFMDLPLLSVDTPSVVSKVKVMSDRDIGGFSDSHFDVIHNGKLEASAHSFSNTMSTSNQKRPERPVDPADPWAPTSSQDSLPIPSHTPSTPETYALFHGNISLELPSDRPDIQRSGYAGFRTLGKPFTLFGSRYHDLEIYRYLAFRVRTDGRKYFVNIQTDSIDETDIHQHRLFTRPVVKSGARKFGAWAKGKEAPKSPSELRRERLRELDVDSLEDALHRKTSETSKEPEKPKEEVEEALGGTGTGTAGDWETVIIPIDDFVRTSFGRVAIHQMGMISQRVKTIGFSTTDRVPGPFWVAIKHIWATNTSPMEIGDGPVLATDWEWGAAGKSK